VTGQLASSRMNDFKEKEKEGRERGEKEKAYYLS
jgi:hypothetical protein